jgi:hypothetical protein
MSTDFYTSAFSQNYMFARSKKMAAPADATYNVIRIPRYAFVKQIWVLITTAYTLATATLEIGWMGNKEVAVTDGFMTSDVTIPWVAGLKVMLDVSISSQPGKYFSAAGGAITVITDDDGGTAGTFFVFVDYSVIF